MPRYLVQTQSGSWYQVDTDQPTVLRWSGHGIRNFMESSDGWKDMKVTEFAPLASWRKMIVEPLYCMHFKADGAWITTSPAISIVHIENLSKRRTVQGVVS